MRDFFAVPLRAMDDQSVNELRQRVEELEAEVADREKDLESYRVELTNANRQLETLIADLHEDIQVAQQIQRALVPTEFPNIPGFEFSTKFIPSAVSGGDYFDIFEHDDKFRFGVLLANSSGPGLSALLLSALLKMTGQLEARKGKSPSEILTQIVSEILPSINETQRCHIFYGVIDRRNYELTYCRLGDVIGLVQDAESGELGLLEAQSGPVQQGALVELTDSQCVLNPRDRLVLCTRGVIEATNRKEETFGQERLFKVILQSPRRGVHELRNEILFEVEKFQQGCPSPMDRTILVSEVKDKVIKLA